MRWIVAVAVVASSLTSALAEETAVELSLEGVVYRGSQDWYLNYCLEDWPASVEARVAPIGSELRSWAGIAFSLSSTPQTHERFRLGIACDPDKSDDDFLPQHPPRDDRVYLYARCQGEWLPGESVLKVMYPLAQHHRGYQWYWRVELDDLYYDLTSWDKWNVGLCADLAYSPDPAMGFDWDCGIRLDYESIWLTISQDTIAIGWTSAGSP